MEVHARLRPQGEAQKGGVEEDESSNIGTIYHDSVGNSKCLYNWLYLYV